MIKIQPGGSGEHSLMIFLLGAMFNLLANLNMENHWDYAIRAIIGGVVWLVFKVIGDWIHDRYFKQPKKEGEI